MSTSSHPWALDHTPRPTLCVDPYILSRSDNCHYLTRRIYKNYFYPRSASFSALTNSHKLHNASATGRG